MIPVAFDVPDLAAALARGPLRPPALVTPAPREVSFGRIAGRVSAGTMRVVVRVDGALGGSTVPADGRFDLAVVLPARDVRVRVVAVDARGRHAARTVAPVYGLPRAATPAGPRRSAEDAALARDMTRLARAYPGVAAVYLQHLRTGVGAAWNARARFPAASTVKVAIAVEVLRELRGPPAPGSSLDRLLRGMIVHSDNAAANSLLTWLGGTISAGATRVNATLRAVGVRDSYLYAGYAVAAAAARPIPLRVEEQPAFGLGKYTTAYDLARLHTLVHTAAGGTGPLHRLAGMRFTVREARYLMWMLAHAADPGKLDRYLPARLPVLHKAGWITTSRHDAGIVCSAGGCIVAAVMTWNANGVGTASDVLAGRVAASALRRFEELRERARERARAAV